MIRNHGTTCTTSSHRIWTCEGGSCQMNAIPDATTVAFYRERPHKAAVMEGLFEMFQPYLRPQGLQARGGKIIEVILVAVP